MPTLHPLLLEDPLTTLQAWQEQATAQGESFTEMALATVAPDGGARVRVVLYKGIWEGKLGFFTNYESRKADEIAQNPRVAVVFHFRALARQIRVEGVAVKLSSASSDSYFATRERESQIGAWASPQSRVIHSREELDQRVRDQTQRFSGQQVPRPAFWGGYGIEPVRFEFWLGAEHRLHDRFEYVKEGSAWEARRLAP